MSEPTTDYAIKLQRMIERAYHGDEIPYPELHHHQMLLELRTEHDALQADNEALRALFDNNAALLATLAAERLESLQAENEKLLEENAALKAGLLVDALLAHPGGKSADE